MSNPTVSPSPRFTVKDPMAVLDEVLNRALNREMKPDEIKAVKSVLDAPREWVQTLATCQKAGMKVTDTLLQAIGINGHIAAALSDGKAKEPAH